MRIIAPIPTNCTCLRNRNDLYLTTCIHSQIGDL
jgi:hypothetical protein